MTDHQLERPPTRTPALYAQDGKGYNAIVHAHYFLAGSDWLVTEYDPDEDVAFGWACLHGDRQNAELGYVNLAELESVTVEVPFYSPRVVGHLPMHVELEKPWTPVSITDAIANLDRDSGRSNA